jgi:SAM-dependent methyltransferase
MAPMIMQSYCSFSVGGTIAVNAHGVTSDYAMYESIVSIELIDAGGDIIVCNREQNQELFSLVIGGYGLFGIIHSVTLKAVPNRKMSLQSTYVKKEQFVKYYEQFLEDDSVEVKIARINVTNMEDIYLTIFRRYSNASTISDLPDQPKQMSLLYRLIYKWFIPLKLMQQARYMLESYLHRPIDWDGHSDRNVLMYESADSLAKLWQPLVPMDRTFILQEYFVPHDKFLIWMEKVKSIVLNKLTYGKLLNITIRYVKKDETTFLPYAQSNMFSFVFYFRIQRTPEADEELRKFHDQLNKITIDLKGTFYLPYRHHYTMEQLTESYPTIHQFFDKKQAYDPINVFSNIWFEAWRDKFLSGTAAITTNNNDQDSSKAHRTRADPSYVIPVVSQHREHSYRDVFKSVTLRNDFEKFLITVFNIETPRSLMAIITRTVWNQENKSDLDVYQELCNYLKIRPLQLYHNIRNAYKTMRQLVDQKKEISTEVVSLVSKLGLNGKIHDYASFGDAGRLVLPLRKKLSMKGKTFIIHDKQGSLDILERGSISPIGIFVPFDYNVVSDITIPSNSVDLVTISMGLHHIPQDKLPVLLQLVHRILRPGGIFIFREHDSRPELLPILDLAHSVFNAVTGVPFEEEKNEIRAFRSVDQWREIVTRHGFEDTYLYELQHDDPTEDYMLCFMKSKALLLDKKQTSDSLVDVKQAFERDGVKLLKSSSASSYYRLTEWMVVRFTEIYASFMHHTPWYRFPYNKFTALYWKALINEILAVKSTRGWIRALTDPGMIMNSVVGSVVTLLFFQLSVLAFPIKQLLRSKNDTIEVEQLIIESKQFIQWNTIDEQITVVKIHQKANDTGYISLIEIPRHIPFTSILLKISSLPDVHLLEMSGQSDDLLIEVAMENNSQIDQMSSIPGSKVLFDFKYPVEDNGRIHVTLRVSIPLLLEVLDSVKRIERVTVIQVYDFL